MPIFSKNHSTNPVSALKPAQRRIFGLIIVGCVVSVAFFPTLKPVALPLAIELAFLSLLAFFYWRWLKGSPIVFAAAVVTFASAVYVAYAYAA